MEETDITGKWVLFWWVGPCSLNLLSNFLLVDGAAVFPPYCLTWDQTIVGIMKIMATSFKRSCASTVVFNAPDPATGHCPPTSLPDTPGHSQAHPGQSLVGSLLLSPGSWCAQGFASAFQESVSSVLCKFCNQIPLDFKVKFPGCSQSLCHVPGLGNLL